ncbi:MAG TPA: hypothetical protein VNZ45_06975, partial [Bacteroidia bacterium]|nr:hypothetical protein [Bacteroidia bacterium]
SGNGLVTYDFGDGQHSSSPPLPHTYHSVNPTGGWQFTQTVPTATRHNGAFYLTYTIPITVVDTTKIKLSYTLCANGEVNLVIKDNRFASYDIDFKDPSSPGITNASRNHVGDTTTTVVPHVYTITGITYNNITVTGKFADGSSGPSCSNTNAAIASITPIATVPTPNVTYLETTLDNLSNGTIAINFNNTSNFDYQLSFARSGFVYDSITTISHSSGITSFTFDKNNTNPYTPADGALYTNYNLNTQQVSYCVKVSSVTSCGTPPNTSEICSITKFTPTAADLENDLTWQAYSGPNVSSIEVYQNSGSTPLSTLSGTATSYNDNNGIVCTTNYCYQLKAVLSTTSASGAPQYSLSASKCVVGTSLATRPPLTNVNS